MKLRYQNIPERIEKLKAHRRTRRGRRDLQALWREVQLAKILESQLSLRKHDDILRHIYTDDLVSSNNIYLIDSNPFLKIKKESGLGLGRRYVQPIEKKGA